MKHAQQNVAPAAELRLADPSSGSPPTCPVCAWCRGRILATRKDAVFCSRKCRQSAFRARRRHQVDTENRSPMSFAYADPPYPGFAKKLYGQEESYAGEVDHGALIVSLCDRFDGWALSTGAYALRDVLPLCPPQARVCAWCKPIGVSSLTYGAHNTWEPLIVVPGRALRPGKRDWLCAQPARFGGTLPGRKPIAFAMWLFSLLGILPGDSFVDLFPGTGMVERCWKELCRQGVVRAGLDDVSSLDRRGASGT